MRDQEALARDAVEVAAGQHLPRRERDGMDQNVEAVPVAAQCCEGRIDLGIARDVHRQRHRRAEALGHLDDPVLQPVVLVGEGEFGALAVHRGRDAVGHGPLGGESDDQRTLASQE